MRKNLRSCLIAVLTIASLTTWASSLYSAEVIVWERDPVTGRMVQRTIFVPAPPQLPGHGHHLGHSHHQQQDAIPLIQPVPSAPSIPVVQPVPSAPSIPVVQPEQPAGMNPPLPGFPCLGHNYQVLAPATAAYNCISWSIGVTDHWEWPGDTEAVFDNLYSQYGYVRVFGLNYEVQPGIDKVVLYGTQNPDGSIKATHAARQLPDGSWSSKLGQGLLIRHAMPDDLDGSDYGVPVAVYVRSHRP